MSLSADFVTQAAASILLFLAFWAIFGNFVVKPMLALLEQREAKTEGAEHEAKQRREEAKSLTGTLNEKRREARLYGITLRDEALKKIQDSAKSIVDSASHRAQEERERTHGEIAELKKRLSGELQQEVQNVSRILEGKILLPPSSTLH